MPRARGEANLPCTHHRCPNTLLTISKPSTRPAHSWSWHPIACSQVLAGFCAYMSSGWPSLAEGGGMRARRLVLNSVGNCSDCTLPPAQEGSIGEIITTASASYVCSATDGDCGVRKVVWPNGTERGLPPWYLKFLLDHNKLDEL